MPDFNITYNGMPWRLHRELNGKSFSMLYDEDFIEVENIGGVVAQLVSIGQGIGMGFEDGGSGAEPVKDFVDKIMKEDNIFTRGEKRTGC